MADQNQNNEAAQKLQALGLRVRAGYAKRHTAKHLQLIRDSVKEAYEQEVKGERGFGSHTRSIERKPSGHDKNREPEEPTP